MIAHSFTGEVFGPAQRLHGATYVVDVEFRRPALDADGIVVDIGRATEALRRVPRRPQLPQPRRGAGLSGKNTTTEFLARHVFDRIVDGDLRGELGPAATGIEWVRVTLHESHVAWAAFEGPVERHGAVTSAARPAVRRLVIAAPGDPLARTGGYIYNRRLAEALTRRGWQVDTCRLADGFPYPSPEALADAAARLGALPAGTTVLVDSLALGAMPDVLAAERTRLRLAGLVHLPLSAHPDSTRAQRPAVIDAEGACAGRDATGRS